MSVKAVTSDITAITAITAAATGRQRRESNRPSGKNSGSRRAKERNEGTQVQRVSQAAIRKTSAGSSLPAKPAAARPTEPAYTQAEQPISVAIWSTR
jgi:hypothetical protein